MKRTVTIHGVAQDSDSQTKSATVIATRDEVENALVRLNAPETPAEKYLPGDVVEYPSGSRYLIIEPLSLMKTYTNGAVPMASCQSGIIYALTKVHPVVVFRKGVRV